MSLALEEQSPETVPRADAFAAVYDRMLTLASEHLTSPISVTVDTWEDGTFRIQAYHQRHPHEREVLYYHSEEGVVRYGVEAGDELKCERVVTRLESSEDSPG